MGKLIVTVGEGEFEKVEGKEYYCIASLEGAPETFDTKEGVWPITFEYKISSKYTDLRLNLTVNRRKVSSKRVHKGKKVGKFQVFVNPSNPASPLAGTRGAFQRQTQVDKWFDLVDSTGNVTGKLKTHIVFQSTLPSFLQSSQKAVESAPKSSSNVEGRKRGNSDAAPVSPRTEAAKTSKGKSSKKEGSSPEKSKSKHAEASSSSSSTPASKNEAASPSQSRKKTDAKAEELNRQMEKEIKEVEVEYNEKLNAIIEEEMYREQRAVEIEYNLKLNSILEELMRREIDEISYNFDQKMMLIDRAIAQKS